MPNDFLLARLFIEPVSPGIMASALTTDVWTMPSEIKLFLKHVSISKYSPVPTSQPMALHWKDSIRLAELKKKQIKSLN